MSVNYDRIRNPQLRQALEEDVVNELLSITTGHDHDGTNSKQVTTGTPADKAVTNAKLADDVKVGSLAALTTTEKGSVVGAVNELVTAIGPLTSKVLEDLPISQSGLSSHDFSSGVVDWVLAGDELLGLYIQATNASGAVNAIVPTTIRLWVVQNSTGQTLTVKTAAGTGVAIANTKSAIVFCNGTNVIRITADA